MSPGHLVRAKCMLALAILMPMSLALSLFSLAASVAADKDSDTDSARWDSAVTSTRPDQEGHGLLVPDLAWHSFDVADLPKDQGRRLLRVDNRRQMRQLLDHLSKRWGAVPAGKKPTRVADLTDRQVRLRVDGTVRSCVLSSQDSWRPDAQHARSAERDRLGRPKTAAYSLACRAAGTSP